VGNKFEQVLYQTVDTSYKLHFDTPLQSLKTYQIFNLNNVAVTTSLKDIQGRITNWPVLMQINGPVVIFSCIPLGHQVIVGKFNLLTWPQQPLP